MRGHDQLSNVRHPSTDLSLHGSSPGTLRTLEPRIAERLGEFLRRWCESRLDPVLRYRAYNRQRCSFPAPNAGSRAPWCLRSVPQAVRKSTEKAENHGEKQTTGMHRSMCGLCAGVRNLLVAMLRRGRCGDGRLPANLRRLRIRLLDMRRGLQPPIKIGRGIRATLCEPLSNVCRRMREARQGRMPSLCRSLPALCRSMRGDGRLNLRTPARCAGASSCRGSRARVRSRNRSSNALRKCCVPEFQITTADCQPLFARPRLSERRLPISH